MTPQDRQANPGKALIDAALRIVGGLDDCTAEGAVALALDSFPDMGIPVPTAVERRLATKEARRAVVAREAEREEKPAINHPERVTAPPPAELNRSLSNPQMWPDGEIPAHLKAKLQPIEPTPFVFRDPASIPRREWLYGTHLIRGEISLTLAPGGVGKTSLAVAEAASLVSGRLLLHERPSKKLRVWLWNGEEPEDELDRRFAAVALHYGLASSDFGDRLFIDTGHALPLVLAEQGKDGVRVHTPVVERLIEALKARNIDIMLVDPFVSTHGVNENDNSAIQRAASAWKTVAHQAGVAIGLAHHVRKLAGRDATAEDSRGGDALVSKARDARTLNPMNAEDAREFGLPSHMRQSYFSTGTGGKSNMAPKSGRKVWFKIESVGLGNQRSLTLPQDHVAVVTPWTPVAPTASFSGPDVLRLAEVMKGEVWRCADNGWKRDDHIGRAVAKAFNIPTDEGFRTQVKPLLHALEKSSVLIRVDSTSRNREVIKTMALGNISSYDV